MSASKLLAGGSFEATSATATLSSAAATLNKAAGRITTEALTTANDGIESFTITNSQVTANSVVLAVISSYAGAGIPVILDVNPAAGSFVVRVANVHDTAALDDPLVFDFVVLGEIS